MGGVKAVCAVASIVVFWASPSRAHGLGERYDLPLPLELYLGGAAVVVALTFVMLALAARPQPAAAESHSTLTVGWRLPLWPGESALILLVRALSTALFILLLVAGFFGSSDPFRNPLPVSVWVLGWVAIAYVSALVGNIWALINPWDNLFRLAEWTWRTVLRRAPRPVWHYPDALEAWPAVGLFLCFAWMELVWPDRDRPTSLATALVIYSAVTWTGMALFGRRKWLENGEFLAVAFGLLARFAIISVHSEAGRPRLGLRPPAVGLLVRRPVRRSLAAFALLMLATVTFDGLIETPLWASLAETALASPAAGAIAAALGTQPYLLLMSAALVAFPLAFAACYLAIATLMAAAVAAAGEAKITTDEIARLFVLTLVPIAIGYHLSHYLSYLLIAGQFIIPAASDPFALGWNLFGTRLYFVDIGIVGARFVWYASLVLIVAGHAIAVWLAHVQAQRRFASRRLVLVSQMPMLGLMVGYTAFSLWILAQPIVEFSG